MRVDELPTPALVAEADTVDRNLAAMAALRPGPRLRPHVKAHKCTGLARLQRAAGHPGFTCATIREVEGMAAAGLGDDLLLANEVLDARRLGAVVAAGSRVTVAVDSVSTIEAAAAGGVREVLIDVNVGLPRCGCDPSQAGPLADAARARGLEVRGVMGYEGHVTVMADAQERDAAVEAAMALLLEAHHDVGGEVVSAGSTVSAAANTWATEIQAGSYVLMDTAFAPMAPAFRPALRIEATVISVAPGYAVADCGLKALGMDHGPPTIRGAKVWFVSDEHITFAPDEPAAVGDRIGVIPSHVDPTVAYHEHLHLARGPDVIATWPVDLRGW